MKKLFAILASMTLALCVLAGCAAGGGSDASVASTEVDFNGSTVKVEVDVSDGWSAEFTEVGTVYLYNVAEPADDATQIANAFIIDQAEYESNLTDYQGSDPSFTEIENGFTAEDGMRCLYHVDGDVYYLIQVDSYDYPDANPEEIFSRFTVTVS